MAATSRSIPDASERVNSVPPQPEKTVYIPLTFSGGFHVSSETFDQAQQKANRSRLTHWIGNLPNGKEVVSDDPEDLKAMGCESVVWVAPERRSPMQQFGDFVVYGPEAR